MTQKCMQYVGGAITIFPVRGKVLEVGSYDVNGSVRPLFKNRHRFPEYTGIDMREGPGVDIVGLASNLPFEPETFDCVVTTEMLEHDSRVWVSVQEFFRVLKPGGHVIITTRNIGFPFHEYPHDYWRFTADGLRVLLEWAKFTVLDAKDDWEDRGSFATGKK